LREGCIDEMRHLIFAAGFGAACTGDDSIGGMIRIADNWQPITAITK